MKELRLLANGEFGKYLIASIANTSAKQVRNLLRKSVPSPAGANAANQKAALCVRCRGTSQKVCLSQSADRASVEPICSRYLIRTEL